jgi:hypothetical protein
MLTVLYFTPLNQTLSPSLAAYIQPGDAEATAHAPLSGKYSSSLFVEIPAFNGISKLTEMSPSIHHHMKF